MKMPKGQRFLWLMLCIERAKEVSVRGEEFVDEYVSATGMRVKGTLFGANWCPQLSKDLGEMYRLGYLSRTPTMGLTAPSSGFPGWVYVYSLAPPAKEYLDPQEGWNAI